MKKLPSATALMLSALALLTGCAPAVSAGTISAKSYTAAHDEVQNECTAHGYVYGYGYHFDPSTAKYKYGYGQTYQCTRHEDVTHHIPAVYELTLKLTDGDEVKRSSFEVSKDVFEKASVGYFYDSDTGELSAR